MVERGNVILVPKGTRVQKQDGKLYTLRKDVIRVAYAVAGGEVTWEQPGGYDWRYVAELDVQLLDAGDHELVIGRRQVRGGSPIRGMGNEYMTSGRCKCGAEFLKRADAREVRERHRGHLYSLAERVLGRERVLKIEGRRA